MKKIKNMSESSFLKLMFVFVGVAFLIAAVCMSDRSQMLSGFWHILSQPCKVTTNYFSVGGFSATFLNMGLVALIIAGLFHVTKTKVNNVSTLAFFLTVGFCTWGIHVLNMWFTMLGVVVANLIKKEKWYANVNAMLFTTGVAPVISDLLVRYPHAETIGFNLLGIILAVVVGVIVGIIVSAGLPHSPNVHKGFNLYSAALPVGMAMFFLNGMLYKVMGVELPGTTGDMAVASQSIVNIFCIALFGLCVVFALAMGAGKDYWALLKNRHQVNNVSGTLGNGVLLMNVGEQFVESKSGLLTTIAVGLNGKVQYALEGSVFIGGAVIQWLRDSMKMITSAPESEGIALSVPDNGGVYVVPAFTGLGAPHWDMYARGTIVGLTRGTGREHIVRASLEAIAYQVADVVRAMEQDTGIRLSALRVDGGASANNFLMQFQADILGSRTVRPVVRETTALGAACLAGLAVGFWGSQDEIRAAWEEDRTFEPAMEEATRAKYLGEWKKAVGRAGSWIEE